jgi:hypothetical protein
MDIWQNQVNWASGLGANLTVTLKPGYTSTVNWATGWRLPATVDGPWAYGTDGTTTAGYNITTSEMGHLFYTELGDKGYADVNGNIQSGWGLVNTGPFTNLRPSFYWSGTEYALSPSGAWTFYFVGGVQDYFYKDYEFYALAVHDGAVVPIPGAIFLFAPGLVGLAAVRRRFKK